MALASLKRSIRVGTRLRVVDHWQEKLRGTERTVTKTQTNGYWFTNDGDDKRYWSEYGPASLLVEVGPGRYRHEDRHIFYELEVL